MSQSVASGPFEFEVRVGQLFTVEAGVLSLLASTCILSFAFVRWVQQWRNPRAATYAATDSTLFLNLMLTDMVQALGVMPNIRWLSDAVITDGTLCRSQGALKHVGMVGVAFSSLSIAVYTYLVLVMRYIPPKHISKYFVLAVWVATALVTGVPNAIHHSRHESLYGPVGFWCWIKYEWRAEQLATMYIWLWMSAVAMLVLYFLIFCSIKGWIGWTKSLPIGRLRRITTHRSDISISDAQYKYSRKTKAVAKLMLYFPAVYIIIILPNSVTRWSEFSGHRRSPSVMLFANTVFALSGFFNIVLFMLTRRRMVIGERVNTPRSNTGSLHRISPNSMRPSSLRVHVQSSRSSDSSTAPTVEIYQIEDGSGSKLDTELSPLRDANGRTVIK